MVQPIDTTEQYPIMLWDVDFSYSDDLLVASDWNVDSETNDLRRDSAIHSSVVMLLFTDRRAPDDRPLPGDDGDRRGWFGDFVDLRQGEGEQPLGSLIWLFERSPLTDRVAEEIRVEAEQALLPLIEQGVAARIEVETDLAKARGSLFLFISIYSQSGDLRYSQRFHRFWTQIHPELGA